MNMKTPEEYFKEQTYGPEGEREFTPAEKIFLQKYLGLDDQDIMGKKSLPPEEHPTAEKLPQVEDQQPAPEETPEASPSATAQTQAVTPPPQEQAPPARPAPAMQPAKTTAKAAAPQEEEEPDLLSQLRKEHELQMVSFTLGNQEFTVPIFVVQEVIRYQQHTKLPAAPPFLAGIVNLRGRVTPLIRLRRLLGVKVGDDSQDKFIVVCRRKGLQMGLMIESVATMYRVTQDRIEWGVESNLGVNTELIMGLMKSNGERLISIISVDHIVDKVIKS